MKDIEKAVSIAHLPDFTPAPDWLPRPSLTPMRSRDPNFSLGQLYEQSQIAAMIADGRIKDPEVEADYNVNDDNEVHEDAYEEADTALGSYEQDLAVESDEPDQAYESENSAQSDAGDEAEEVEESDEADEYVDQDAEYDNY